MYSVLEPLASGGMGTVYRAVQDTPQRVVALKMLRAGSADASALRRFQVEAEILGRLQHPNVAQIYEAGVVTREVDGAKVERPYLAMELVEDARTIVEHCERERLGLGARIALVRAACAGVHHAHQRGIIHRDLKPGNLLVDRQGRVKVIDFGVARATEADLATSFHSLPGTVIGTLLTMSPEQVDADGEVDVRTDVYALGAVAYRLVCGQWPYSLEGLGLAQAADVIRRRAPVRPRELVPSLAPDVEWILLEALEKEKRARYGSVHELAEDLRRYQEHEPVRAGPPSTTYRVRKFVRRHPAAAGAFAALVLGAAGTLAGLLRAEEALAGEKSARRAAQSEARRANAIQEIVTDLFLSTLASRGGSDPRLSEVLDDAAAELEATERAERTRTSSRRCATCWAARTTG